MAKLSRKELKKIANSIFEVEKAVEAGTKTEAQAAIEIEDKISVLEFEQIFELDDYILELYNKKV